MILKPYIGTEFPVLRGVVFIEFKHVADTRVYYIIDFVLRMKSGHCCRQRDTTRELVI